MPPKRNITRKPRQNSTAVLSVMVPRHMVPIQLKNLMPVGTAIRSDIAAKKGSRTAPVVYMWCAHTPIDRAPIERVAPIMPL
jgi:hypothetical protein